MEPSSHDMIPLYKILYFIKGMGLLAEWKKMGMHNISEDGCSARPTYLRTLLNLMYNQQLT
jgi:hypothetical protein